MLTQSSWDQIAPHYRTIVSQAEYAHLKLNHLIDVLSRTPKVSARQEWIKAHGDELKESHRRTQIADESLYQFEALRCWWLVLSEDPAAEYFSRELMMRKVERKETSEQELVRIREALERAGETRWWNYIHAPLASRQIKRLATKTRDDIERFAGASAASEEESEPIDPGAIEESNDR